MKTEMLYLQGLNREITFYIGQCQAENFDVIDMGKPDDIWFHAADISSCHVIAHVPSELSNKELKYVIKAGAMLCKNHTKKLKNSNDIEIAYTKVKYIEKTQYSGCVKIINEKKIKL
jgi:predicted ribosome quality control (RQC) complex YloA/Tae2 family protein